MEERSRRLRRMQFSADFLITFFMKSLPRYPEILHDAVPDDALVVGSHYDPERHLLTLVISSNEFDLVPDDAVIPTLETIIRTSDITYKRAELDYLIDLVRDATRHTYGERESIMAETRVAGLEEARQIIFGETRQAFLDSLPRLEPINAD